MPFGSTCDTSKANSAFADRWSSLSLASQPSLQFFVRLVWRERLAMAVLEAERQTCPRTAEGHPVSLRSSAKNGCHRAALCPFKCTEPTFDCPYPRIFPLNERE